MFSIMDVAATLAAQVPEATERQRVLHPTQHPVPPSLSQDNQANQLLRESTVLLQ